MKEFTKRINITTGLADCQNLEDAVIECEYRYNQLLSAVTDYVYTVIVERGRPVRTIHGHGCIAITGYSSGEYESDPFLWHKMVHPEDRDYVTDHVNRVISGEPVSYLEHRIIHKNNSVRWIKHTPVQHFDETGRLVSYNGLISDITEQKKLKEQLYHSQKMESIGRLAGGVAHDFNNYLSAIIGLAELSQMKIKPDEACYQNLDKIRDAAFKAANITRQLLAFSSRQIIEPKVLDLNNSIREFAKMLGHLIGEDIELVAFLADGLGSVKADPTQIEQIIINLAVNSRDAIFKKGKIIIKTDNVEINEDQSKDACIPAGRYILMSFSDSGIGISKDAMPHIFEPFFTTKEKGKGTGLGLSTVYGIVEQHGGKILACSEEGQGTTFSIYLPRVDEKPDAGEIRVKIQDYPSCAETVLVVDDSEIVRDFVVQILRAYSYTVYEACNGLEALEIFKKMKQPANLIITDIVMPSMGGLELTEELKNIRNDIKVLFMSGYADEVVSAQGRLNENVKFINKPFVTSDLLRKVREVLET